MERDDTKLLEVLWESRDAARAAQVAAESLGERLDKLEERLAPVERHVASVNAVFRFAAWAIGILIALGSALAGISKAVRP